MTSQTSTVPTVREDLWDAWVARGRRNDRATARLSRVVFTAAAVVYAAVAAGLYVSGQLLR